MEDEIIIIEDDTEQELVIVENDVEYIPPVTQEKTITASLDTQVVTPDEDYTGLSKVTVNGFPINLGEKTITENGVYNASKDGFTGYSQVKVQTEGGDIVYTGSYDREGLKQIGYTDEEIDYFNKYGVTWNEEDNNLYKLTDKELAGDTSSNTRFLPANTTKTNFQNMKYLMVVPFKVTSNLPQAPTYLFADCYNLRCIPPLNLTKTTNFSHWFDNCTYLTTIPEIYKSNGMYIEYMPYNCSNLKKSPIKENTKIRGGSDLFHGCSNLTTIPKLDYSGAVNLSSFCYGCNNLREIPDINTTSILKYAHQAFYDCSNLVAIPNIDISNVSSLQSFGYRCRKITKIPKLNLMSATVIDGFLSYCYSLIEIGGFENLGQAYEITANANYYYYTLNLNNSCNLTHESLMNVINGLYDIKTKGCNTQQLVLGSTNLAKLTAEEIAIATEKGWSVS